VRLGTLRAPAVTLAVLSLAAAWPASRRAQPVLAADDPQPPAWLHETGLFEAGRPDAVPPENRPFSPQYPLWSDGAAKRRWVRLPPGTAIRASETGAWEFPEGTRFWKEFAFAGRRVETRLLWKTAGGRWATASYVWNEEQTDAALAPEAGLPRLTEIAPGRRHSIPARADCALCHGSPARPLGFAPLQLSSDRDPGAIHGEPLAPGMLTLDTLVREGLLVGPQQGPAHASPRITTRSPRTRAALGYLAANCGACHNRSGEIAASVPSLAYEDVMADGDAVARSLVGRATRWQVPGAAEGTSVVVEAAAPGHSALLARMGSRRPSAQMPPLGTVLRDQEALDALEAWIRTDLAPERVASR
jgi:cytochrome c553